MKAEFNVHNININDQEIYYWISLIHINIGNFHCQK